MSKYENLENYREVFLIQQIYATLFSLTNKVQVHSDKYLDKLTSRQVMAMMAICHLPEDETTINNIARKLGTTKQSVKQIITVIEDKGYAITVPSKKDKRAVNIKITLEGQQALIESGRKSVAFFAEFSSILTKEEMEILWMLLKKLYSFDGEQQDGFEEEANAKFQMDEKEIDKESEIMLKEFGRIRNGGKKNE